jgi:alpha-beta hydrolase superfamily lysophospholipase
MKLTQRLAIGYIQTKFKLLRLVSKRKTAEQAFKLFSTPYMRSKNKALLKNAEPLNFSLNGNTISGYRWNHPQEKKVLILHGFGSAAHKFAEYAKPLTEKGYEVLAFDAPAHGNSNGQTTNAVEYSEMIKKVATQYGPINSFVAHSFGGIALSLALEEMEHDAETRIAFIAPATETTTAVDIAFKMLKLKDEKVRNEFDNIILEISGKKTEWFSIRRAMHNIKASVLWVHDEEDDVTPWADAAKVKEDNHPHIRFVVTKGLGHRKIYHEEAIKNSVTEFM